MLTFLLLGSAYINIAQIQALMPSDYGCSIMMSGTREYYEGGYVIDTDYSCDEIMLKIKEKNIVIR